MTRAPHAAAVLRLVRAAEWVHLDALWDILRAEGRWVRKDQRFLRRRDLASLTPGILVAGVHGQGPKGHRRFAIVRVDGARALVSEGRWTDTEALTASGTVPTGNTQRSPFLGPCQDGEGGH